MDNLTTNTAPLKRCSKCKEWKPLAMFSRYNRTKDGLKYECKACRRSPQSIANIAAKAAAKAAIPEGYKQCTQCGLIQPLAMFCRNKNTKDGLRPDCRDCLKRYREENAEALKEYNQTWRKENTEYIRAKNKAYREAAPEAHLTRNRSWYETNQEYARRKSREHYHENAEEINRRKRSKPLSEARKEKNRLDSRRRRELDPEKANAASKNWAARNPERVRARSREYARAHPESGHRRRMLKRASINTFTRRDIDHILFIQEGKCAYCGRLEQILQIEHIIPIFRQGSNGPENICLACRRCNLSKGTKLLHEWKRRWYLR
jgi:hypothetical protein